MGWDVLIYQEHASGCAWCHLCAHTHANQLILVKPTIHLYLVVLIISNDDHSHWSQLLSARLWTTPPMDAVTCQASHPTTEEKEALTGPRTQLTEALLGFKCDLEPFP